MKKIRMNFSCEFRIKTSINCFFLCKAAFWRSISTTIYVFLNFTMWK